MRRKFLLGVTLVGAGCTPADVDLGNNSFGGDEVGEDAGPGDSSDTGGTNGDGDGDGDGDDGPGFCEAGTVVCDGSVAKVCDGAGGFEEETLCSAQCEDGVGCVGCTEGETRCNGTDVEICNAEGTDFEPYQTCDGMLGLACDPEFGTCNGPCAFLGASYIGCDYYPQVSQQFDSFLQNDEKAGDFGVAVANTTDEPATVSVTRGDELVAQFEVPAGSVGVQLLPWVDELGLGLNDPNSPSRMVEEGSYRLRSTRPVTVYQYNPLEAATSNDASLLFPVNTWANSAVVATWPSYDSSPIWSYPSFFQVTASEDNTEVTILPATHGAVVVQSGGGVGSDGSGVVVLNAGDVLQVNADDGGDLTGTRVLADKSIQVIGGHDCAQVPLGTPFCDHLEESMLSIDALSKEYIVVPPVEVPNVWDEKDQVIRVIAVEDETEVIFEPDQGADALLANAGDFIELGPSSASFRVVADKKIAVAQYMVSQNFGAGTSDPAMLMAVPVDQFRDSYLIFAPTSWPDNLVDILAPDDAEVTVDGAAVDNFESIPGTGFKKAHYELSNFGDGTHEIEGTEPFGVSVYGILDYGSFWYPGGLDLTLIPG